MTTAAAFALVVGAVVVIGRLLASQERRTGRRPGDEDGTTAAFGALTRLEARQLLRHPAWGITLIVLSATVIALTLLSPDPQATLLPSERWFAMCAVPISGLALVVSAHRVGTRSRRSGISELEASMPTSPRTRTASLLAACVAPVPLLVVAGVTGLAVSRWAFPRSPGVGVGDGVVLSVFVLTGVGGAVVGVLLSRWLPVAVGSLGGVAALLWLNNGPGHAHPRDRFLRVFSDVSFGGPYDIVPRAAWAAVVLALVLFGACLALWSHPPCPWLVGTTAIVVAALVVAGQRAAAGPSRADVVDVVTRLERPDLHQSCERRRGVRYCVEPGAESWIDLWAPTIAAVRRGIPPDARPDVVVRQRPLAEVRGLLPDVRAALDPSAVWERDGDVHPSFELSGTHPDLSVAWQYAAAAVGLPPSVDWGRQGGCVAGGQARIVLTHVVAALASPSVRAAIEARAGEVRVDALDGASVPVEVEGLYDVDTPQGEGAEVVFGQRRGPDGSSVDYLTAIGASGYGSDLLVAVAILDADQRTVDRVVRTHWAELTDPTTPTERFAALVGVRPTPTARPITSPTDPHACPAEVEPPSTP